MASDLFGVRLTPSTRLRDPYAAKNPTQHVLTEQQIDLWNLLVPNHQSRVVDIKDKKPEVVFNEIVGRLPEKAKATLIPAAAGLTLEVIVPR